MHVSPRSTPGRADSSAGSDVQDSSRLGQTLASWVVPLSDTTLLRPNIITYRSVLADKVWNPFDYNSRRGPMDFNQNRLPCCTNSASASLGPASWSEAALTVGSDPRTNLGMPLLRILC